jgi:hypothetical protein
MLTKMKNANPTNPGAHKAFEDKSIAEITDIPNVEAEANNNDAPSKRNKDDDENYYITSYVW